MRELLAAGYSGNELDRLAEGTARTKATLRNTSPLFNRLTDHAWQAIDKVVYGHFSPYREGVFGGQITAGEGWFIGAWMSAMRPAAMIEIGVASGYASALILSFAEEFHLLRDGVIYLHSIDNVDEHSDGGVVGSLMQREFKHLLPYWSLQTGVTTATVQSDSLTSQLPSGPVMAFLDANFQHPWPVVDLSFLQRCIPACEWAILKNAVMTERWLADAVIYGAPVPSPARGVQHATTHWPGHKTIGADICFNMAALGTRVSDVDLDHFCLTMSRYPRETLDDQGNSCDAFMARLGYRI